MNISTLTNKAEALGYIVDISEGEIRYVRPANRDSYTPELFSPSIFDEAPSWTIQTAGYGPKASDEITEVIDGFQRAQQMVKLLEAWGA